MKMAIILSTYPSKESAVQTANRLVAGRLAACVNMLPVSSVYAWKGKVEAQQEYLAVFKTEQKNADRLRQEIQDTHPYDVPEIAELEAKSANDSYLRWLAESTS